MTDCSLTNAFDFKAIAGTWDVGFVSLIIFYPIDDIVNGDKESTITTTTTATTTTRTTTTTTTKTTTTTTTTTAKTTTTSQNC